MESLENPDQDGAGEEHIVRADEVDNIGIDMSTGSDEQLIADAIANIELPEGSEVDIDGEDGYNGVSLPQRHSQPPARPELRRDRVAPPPPLQPPPPAPVQQSSENQTDSVSLAQLRKLVQDLPKSDLPSYAFKYDDCEPFVEEINEWFEDNESDKLMLLSCKTTFEHTWLSFTQSMSEAERDICWIDASDQTRTAFMKNRMGFLTSPDIFVRIEALEGIAYMLTGVWVMTAGKVAEDYPSETTENTSQTFKERSMQIQWMVKNVKTLQQCQGIPALLSYVGRAFDKDLAFTPVGSKVFAHDNETTASTATRDKEINLLLSCVYMVIEVARRELKLNPSDTTVKDDIVSSSLYLPGLLVEVVARLRWEDPSVFPLTRILLLFWKVILLLFGGTDSLKKAKTVLEPAYEATSPGGTRSSNIPTLTASPLDYHLFRQEITSKYPAYDPPPPLVPFELEHNSVLPPLPTSSSRNPSSLLFSGVGSTLASNNDSILHQSVHIATPAPSPPPTPGAQGKVGKKQNYQTNQHFPFMYPPLDGSSNNIGGKGSSDLQDNLVGRKWEGSDVPASIIEAGELFSSRMRMTRALEQLWEEREAFMKYDRGWDETVPHTKIRIGEATNETNSGPGGDQQIPSKVMNDDDVQARLDAVEKFYVHALPNLQSFVIVVLKELLTGITAIASKSNNGDNGDGRTDGHAMNGFKQASNKNRMSEPFLSMRQIQEGRAREIRFKAISGVLILLLKWFKRCHILCFEYLSQILLDSNYIPLILKMFIHQEVDHAVAQPQDPQVSSFFHFCHVHSDQPPEPIPPLEPTEIADDSSEDEAAPPPILRQSRSRISMLEEASAKSAAAEQAKENSRLLEVDELGFPIAPIEPGPITTYSFRNFFSAINFLHIMQKITRDKAHRCLLLVQYKCSAVLRKGLKIPDPHLRLYTLKLFKSQVPYCGRKWRLSHMRVITAIYLYCRPELRDDWLAGGDVDAEVEESLPMEQALRGLTYWWHVRRYKDILSAENGQPLVEEERDFFTRELEKIGWGWFGDELAHGVDEDVDFAPYIGGGPELEKAIQMEAL